MQQQVFGNFSSEKNQTQNERLRLQHQNRIEAVNRIKRKRNWNVINWHNNWINLTLKFKTKKFSWKTIKWFPQPQERCHHKKYEDLNFQILLHSFIRLKRNDKKEQVLLLLLASLRIFFLIQQILCLLRINLMILFQLLWIENTMIPTYNIFFINFVNQALLMYLSPEFSTHWKTILLKKIWRQKSTRYFFTNSGCIRTFSEQIARSWWIFRTT